MTALWTRRAVQVLVLREASLEMLICAIEKYLRRWGFTPQRLLRKVPDQLPEAVKDTVNKAFLIVDNLRVHYAIKGCERLEQEERSKKLGLFFLPPYSPMLNPDEYFNRDLKKPALWASGPHRHSHA